MKIFDELMKDESLKAALDKLPEAVKKAAPNDHSGDISRWLHGCDECKFLGNYFVANKRPSIEAVLNLSEEEADYVFDLYLHAGSLIVFRWGDTAGPHNEDESVGSVPLEEVEAASHVPLWHPAKEAQRRTQA
jgi:hypothetical protein